jgi:predicted acetyltransferase
VIDLPGALTSRGYPSEVDVVLDVTDARCPWNAGRWRLSAGPTGSTCEPTRDPADLALDVRELGATYLGGVTFETLGRADLVEERTAGALAACSAAFRASVLPATPYMF